MKNILFLLVAVVMVGCGQTQPVKSPGEPPADMDMQAEREAQEAKEAAEKEAEDMDIMTEEDFEDEDYDLLGEYTEGMSLAEAEKAVMPLSMHMLNDDPVPTNEIDLFASGLEIPEHVYSNFGTEAGSVMASFYPYTDENGQSYTKIEVTYDYPSDLYAEDLYYRGEELVFVQQYYTQFDRPQWQDGVTVAMWYEYHLSSGSHEFFDGNTNGAEALDETSNFEKISEYYQSVFQIMNTI